MDINTIWAEGLEEEVKSWHAWLTEDRFADARAQRLEQRRQFQFQNQVEVPSKGKFQILDIGSGPISSLGSLLGEKEANLVPLDPLADEYNALLKETGYSGYPEVIKGVGEKVSEYFLEDEFDYVFAGNSLDHSYDPITVVREMIKVCKPGGRVHIVVKDNEGERQSYQGLHQWNFAIADEKVLVWRPEEKYILNDVISGVKIIKVQSSSRKNDFHSFDLLTILLEPTVSTS